MKLDDIGVLKQDDRGIIYDCKPVSYIVRYKGTVSADHSHQEAEILYLLEGEAEVTGGDGTEVVKAPKTIIYKSNEYHKLVALTEIKFIELRFRN